MLQAHPHAATEHLVEDVSAQLAAGMPNSCPVEFLASATRMLLSRSCGKCVPCRVGLRALFDLLDAISSFKATEREHALLRATAQLVVETADCAIGVQAAQLVLDGLHTFAADFTSHIEQKVCCDSFQVAVPCVAECPAQVDVPGYIALISVGRYDDAVQLIRKDNPLPVACGLICEHPCEAHCRRGLQDDALNIRGLKRYATVHATTDELPPAAEPTGKTVGIVGGGPAGLTAAHYLRLMGHSVTIFERHEHLGGMLRYGIPSYRLPQEELDRETSLITTGITVKTGVAVGADIDFKELRERFDVVYIANGAQLDKRLGIPGEDAPGVMSAIELLRRNASGDSPDFSGKRVAVVGGGNVAMDAARTAVRLGARAVDIVYRRRQADMTALPVEIEGAIAEGCFLAELYAPIAVETDAQGAVSGLKVAPQIIGAIKDRRAQPRNADTQPVTLHCDIVIVAIGQSIDLSAFESAALPSKWGALIADGHGIIKGHAGIFAGGECVTGPSSAIKAIAAGKAAAAAIDGYLGYKHRISTSLEIPDTIPLEQSTARVSARERSSSDRRSDFKALEITLSTEEAYQESSRCLRCDKHGLGSFEGGRNLSW
jgi:NADPH-dependent glutamate synthase beta subunit-like oxidoreductase